MKVLAVLLLLAAASVPVLAAPISGTIFFEYTATSAFDYGGHSITGPDAPTGSYTYDPASGLFTDFSVLWGNAVFDFTSSANAPSLATDPATGCSSAVPG